MRRLLFLMMMMYSGYSFGGNTCSGYATLNGKVIGASFPINTLAPGLVIDSAYCFYGNDTIDPNNAVIQLFNGSSGGLGIMTYIYYSATDSNSSFSLDTDYFSKSGYYSIDFSSSYCDAYLTMHFVFANTTGIPVINSELNPIKVLSNPVSSTLKLNSQQTISHLNIYDELGRLELSNQPTITSQYNYQVGVDALAKGIYIVEATLDTDKKDYIKIVKQ